MFAKFQLRFLINALVVIGVMSGFSHQMFAQYSEHHHSACGHSHTETGHHDGDEGQDSQDQSNDCTCHLCGHSINANLSAPNSFRAPTFSLSEIPDCMISENPVPVVQGIYHPPQG